MSYDAALWVDQANKRQLPSYHLHCPTRDGRGFFIVTSGTLDIDTTVYSSQRVGDVQATVHVSTLGYFILTTLLDRVIIRLVIYIYILDSCKYNDYYKSNMCIG